MSRDPIEATPSRSPRGDALRTASRIVFIGFVAIAGFYLVTEHRAHLFGALPFLLLAACPLLHLFHHRAHRADEERPSSGANSRISE